MSLSDPFELFMRATAADTDRVDVLVQQAVDCMKVDVDEFLRNSYNTLLSVKGCGSPLHHKLFVVAVALMVSQSFNDWWRKHCSRPPDVQDTFQVHVNNTILRLFYRLNSRDTYSTGPSDVAFGHIVNAMNNLRLLMDMGCLSGSDLSMNTEYI